MKILGEHTHTHTHTHTRARTFTFKQSWFQTAGRRAKHYGAAVCNSPNSFPLSFFTLQSILLNVTLKHFQFPNLPKYQTKLLASLCLCGEISWWCLHNTEEQKFIPSTHNFTVTITNGSYMYQLHSSHQQAVCVSSITVNHIPAIYIQLKMYSRRNIGLTYNCIQLLHINKHFQYK